MAKQFTDQPLLTTADATDVIPIRDISAGVDKKTTVSGLAAAVAANIPSGSVTNSMLATSAGQPGGAWEAYTPTWTGATIGNGSITGHYKQIGKTVHFRFKFVIGSTTTQPTGGVFWKISLPVAAAAAEYAGSGGGYGFPIGVWYGENPGTSGYAGTLPIKDANGVYVGYTSATTGAQAFISGSSWATNWYLQGQGTYEAA
ncbi:hypothetical protein QM806_04315 [Rhodococcus sp. IEGM 1351]|uniref:hypothetical protein n=1 Tax=Rhodococcus sp. IEGM 1351 TaxID=3047089 RepID=UPI0024B872B0|nr:hypothetical protein [Rhodococcus sp. IEGM 1351]MDI9934678.1 hypothetical protein [Rhodococcus sp. IEGM 1351]